MIAKFANRLKTTWVIIGLLAISNIIILIFYVDYKYRTNKDIEYYLQVLSKSQDRDRDAVSCFFGDDGSSEHARLMENYYESRFAYLNSYTKYIMNCEDIVRREMANRYPKNTVADAYVFVDRIPEDQIMDSYYSKDLLKKVKSKTVYDYVLILKSLALLHDNISRLSYETIEQERAWGHKYNLRIYYKK